MFIAPKSLSSPWEATRGCEDSVRTKRALRPLLQGHAQAEADALIARFSLITFFIKLEPKVILVGFVLKYHRENPALKRVPKKII